MVIDRRPQLASGLRRPLGAVWPEPVSHEHEGRLELWVGRADISKARPPAWPLLRAGQADVFQPQPFGVDVRGKGVKAPMAYLNMLIGSIPRQGKTAAVRVRACTYALDPIVEMWLHELKGSGDLDPLEQVSHRFVSGIDDASIAYAAESLKLLKAEIERRTERLRALPREVCPDKRVTREIGTKRSLRLWPIACVIDECQNLFAHEKYGKQAGDDAMFIIKIGPAFGVMLDLATQRPDAKSLPTGVSSNVGLRFCLKVMDQTANDMVLGTSAYKNGIRATTFRPEVDAGIGYLVGASSHPQVVRTYYLDMPAAERVAKRARALREAAGTLSGVALGEDDAAPQRDVLADAAEALAGVTGMHWQALADRLAERFPERWAERDRRRRAGRARRPRRAVRGRRDGRHAGPRLPRRRRRQGGERHMRPAPDAQNCDRPDLRRNPGAVHAVTRPPALTCEVTGNGTRTREDGGNDPMALLAGTGTEHRYQTCDDECCDRFPCRVYKEGYEAGLRRRVRGRLRRGPR